MGETRDKVLALYRDGKTTPKEIAEALGGSYDNAARHLRLLKRDGLLHPDHPESVVTPESIGKGRERALEGAQPADPRTPKGSVPMTQSRFQRGDRVTVTEENIRPWTGVVTAVKWSNVSGWWVSVRRDGMEYNVPEALVRKNRKGGFLEQV